ncbi:hypothetical protein HK100_001836, partial [Physocladia obscura]
MDPEAVYSQIACAFTTASQDSATHARLAKELVQLVAPAAPAQKNKRQQAANNSNAVSLKVWLLSMWRAVLCVLATKRVAREPAQKSLKFIEAIIKALAVLKSTRPDELNQQSFVAFLLTRLSKGSNAKQAHVRFRVCQMLDDMHEALKTVLIQRSKDKDANVRVQASMALTRFQGPPDDVDEQVVDILTDLMTGDPHADVRKTLLWNTDISTRTLIPLLQRATDVDVNVRRMVYLKFAASIPDMMELPREVRIALLSVGLKDRDAGVRKKCKALLCDYWWKARDWNAVDFLREIDVRSVAAEEALIALISANLITLDFLTDDMWDSEISIEFVFFACIYAKSLAEKKAENQIQNFLPSLTIMTALLQKFTEMIKNPPSADEDDVKAVEFVMTRLLQITEFHDFADEMGRR